MQWIKKNKTASWKVLNNWKVIPKAWWKKAKENEPIKRFGEYLEKEKIADKDELEQIRKEVLAYLKEVIDKAMAAPDPEPEDTLEDVFA